MQDLYQEISVAQSLAPASRTAAVDGSGVDLANFDAAVVLIDLGAIGGSASPTFTFELQESDDNSVFTAVADADLQGTEPVVTTSENTVRKIGYHGTKRYVRVTIKTVSGTSPTLLCGAHVVRAHGRKRPD